MLMMNDSDHQQAAVRCDLCEGDTSALGYASRHDGEHYRVQMCESYFFLGDALYQAKAIETASI